MSTSAAWKAWPVSVVIPTKARRELITSSKAIPLLYSCDDEAVTVTWLIVKSLLNKISPPDDVKLVLLDAESIRFKVTSGIAEELEPSESFTVIVVPSEIDNVKDINAIALLDNGRTLDISQLTSLIKGSSFVVANDTGPAHIAAHVGAKGLTLFGKHTTAYKVSIERDNFKAIEVSDLNNLSAEKVFEKLTNSLS